MGLNAPGAAGGVAGAEGDAAGAAAAGLVAGGVAAGGVGGVCALTAVKANALKHAIANAENLNEGFLKRVIGVLDECRSKTILGILKTRSFG
jgi:hypothetical protein